MKWNASITHLSYWYIYTNVECALEDDDNSHRVYILNTCGSKNRELCIKLYDTVYDNEATYNQ
jgi:hypothetical protein